MTMNECSELIKSATPRKVPNTIKKKKGEPSYSKIVLDDV